MIRIINEIIKIKDQINNPKIVKKEKKNQVKNESIILNHLTKKYSKQTYLQENLTDKNQIQIIIIKLMIVAKMKTYRNIKRSLKNQIISKKMRTIKCQLKVRLYQ